MCNVYIYTNLLCHWFEVIPLGCVIVIHFSAVQCKVYFNLANEASIIGAVYRRVDKIFALLFCMHFVVWLRTLAELLVAFEILLTYLNSYNF